MQQGRMGKLSHVLVVLSQVLGSWRVAEGLEKIKEVTLGLTLEWGSPDMLHFYWFQADVAGLSGEGRLRLKRCCF